MPYQQRHYKLLFQQYNPPVSSPSIQVNKYLPNKVFTDGDDIVAEVKGLRKFQSGNMFLANY